MSSGSCMASPSLYPSGGEAQGGAAARGRAQGQPGAAPNPLLYSFWKIS